MQPSQVLCYILITTNLFTFSKIKGLISRVGKPRYEFNFVKKEESMREVNNSNLVKIVQHHHLPGRWRNREFQTILALPAKDDKEAGEENTLFWGWLCRPRTSGTFSLLSDFHLPFGHRSRWC